MWFKNLTVFRLPANWSVSTLDLRDILEARRLQPCPSNMTSVSGWVAPGPSGALVESVGDSVAVYDSLIALGVTEKSIPSASVKQFAAARAEAVAAEQGYPVGKRQMRELKESVLQSLIPNAIPKTRQTTAWIDRGAGLLVVNTSSPKRADEVVSALREALGTFAATPIETAQSPSLSAAAWLSVGDAPRMMSIDQELHLQASDKTRATVKYNRCALDSKDILQHLQTKSVTAIGLSWTDKLSFVLTDKLVLKKVEMLAIHEEKPAEGDPISAEEQFITDFALMTSMLSSMLEDLVMALGGYPRAEPMTDVAAD